MLTLFGAICCSEIPPSSNTQISCLLRKLRNFPVAKGGITDFIKLCVCNTYKLPEMVTAVCATFHSSRRTSEILQSFYWWQLCSQTCHKIVGHWSAPCAEIANDNIEQFELFLVLDYAYCLTQESAQEIGRSWSWTGYGSFSPAPPPLCSEQLCNALLIWV